MFANLSLNHRAFHSLAGSPASRAPARSLAGPGRYIIIVYDAAVLRLVGDPAPEATRQRALNKAMLSEPIAQVTRPRTGKRLPPMLSEHL